MLDYMERVWQSRYAHHNETSHDPNAIDTIIKNLSERAMSLNHSEDTDVMALSLEFREAISACEAEHMLDRLEKVLLKTGGEIQIIEVDRESELPQLNDRTVWGHAGKYITIFALKGELATIRGRAKIIGRLFHEIRARSTRARDIWNEALNQEGPTSIPEVLVLAGRMQQEFERINNILERAITKNLSLGRAPFSDFSEELREELNELEFTEERPLELRDYATREELLRGIALLYKRDTQRPARVFSSSTFLMNLAIAITGSWLVASSDQRTIDWFLSQLRREGIDDLEAYLGQILDSEGNLKDAHREEAEALFNRVLLAYPEEMEVYSDTATFLNRNPGEFQYFADEVLPLIIAQKLTEGEKALRINIIGPSEGKESASIYYYMKKAFESNPTWGSMDEWDVEIHGIDISSKALKAARSNLLKEEVELKDLVPTGDIKTIEEIMSSIRQMPQALRQKVFKFTHGNIAYQKDRESFLEGSDAVFANLTLYQIVSSVREDVISALHDRGIWVISNSLRVYEQAPAGVSAVQIPKVTPGIPAHVNHAYVIAPPNQTLAQPDVEFFSFESAEQMESVFDDLGSFLKTHPYFNSRVTQRDNYNREEHVKRVAQTIRAGHLRLAPYTIKSLGALIGGPGVPAEYKDFARELLSAQAETQLSTDGIVGAMHQGNRFEAFRRLLRMKGIDIRDVAEQEEGNQTGADNQAVDAALKALGFSDDTRRREVAQSVVLMDVPKEIELDRGEKGRLGALIIGKKDGEVRILLPRESIRDLSAQGLGDLLHEICEIEFLEAGMSLDDAHYHAMRARDAWEDRGIAGAREVAKDAKDPCRLGKLERGFEIILHNVIEGLGIATEDLSSLEAHQILNIRDSFLVELEAEGWHVSPKAKSYFAKVVTTLITKEQIDDFKEAFATFTLEDMILCLRRLHTLAHRMKESSISDGMISLLKLHRVISDVRMSDNQALDMLERAGLAGEVWERGVVASPDVQALLEAGRAKEVAERFSAERPGKAVMQDLKAIFSFFGIDMFNMEETFFENLIITIQNLRNNIDDYIEVVGTDVYPTDACIGLLDGKGLADQRSFTLLLNIAGNASEFFIEKLRHEGEEALSQLIVHDLVLASVTILYAYEELKARNLQLERFIQRGHDAVVFLARNQDGERVIVKISHARDPVTNEVVLEQLNDITELASSNPHFAANLELAEVALPEGQRAILQISEFIPGVHLSDLRRRRDLWGVGLDELINIAVQFFDAERFLLEGNRRVNTDVKNTTNFILGTDGILKLVDLGGIVSVRGVPDDRYEEIARDHKRDLILVAINLLFNLRVAAIAAVECNSLTELFANLFGEEHRQVGATIARLFEGAFSRLAEENVPMGAVSVALQAAPDGIIGAMHEEKTPARGRERSLLLPPQPFDALPDRTDALSWANAFMLSLRDELRGLEWRDLYANIRIPVTELVTNLMMHGRGGEIEIYYSESEEGLKKIEVVGIDRGPGIDDPNVLLQDSIAIHRRIREHGGPSQNLPPELKVGRGFRNIAVRPHGVRLESRGKPWIRVGDNDTNAAFVLDEANPHVAPGDYGLRATLTWQEQVIVPGPMDAADAQIYIGMLRVQTEDLFRERLTKKPAAKKEIDRFIVMTRAAIPEEQQRLAASSNLTLLDKFLRQNRGTKLILVDTVEEMNELLEDQARYRQNNTVLVTQLDELDTLARSDLRVASLSFKKQGRTSVPLVGVVAYADTLLDINESNIDVLMPILERQFSCLVGDTSKITDDVYLERINEHFGVPEFFLKTLNEDPVEHARRVYLLIPPAMPEDFNSILDEFITQDRQCLQSL